MFSITSTGAPAVADAQNLAQLRVLVTRPAHQAGRLVKLIEAEGGTAVEFPTIEISPPRDRLTLQRLIDRLDSFEIAIFVSPNAVREAMALISERRSILPQALILAAIGRATARELERFGVAATVVPSEKFDSESLLASPQLQAIEDKHIIIFRGEGGRELLGQTLAARGAAVEYADCYRRTMPRTDATPLLDRWQRGLIDIVTATSVQGLENLFIMLGESGRALLLKTPIVVISERMAQTCRELGFAHAPAVADEASDEGIVQAIKAWRASQKPV
ncbi:MAG: uroporphyrinogen-III synthase [Acidiferrobacterales bacterium]